MRDWHRLRKFSWQERWWLLQAAIMLPVVTLALRRLGFARCRAMLRRLSPRHDPVPQPAGTVPAAAATIGSRRETQIVAARRVARMVEIATRRSRRANCLQQSLVLWWLLRTQGIPSEIRFGTRIETPGPDAARSGTTCLQAHAWVECGGDAVGENDAIRHRFVPLEARPEKQLTT